MQPCNLERQLLSSAPPGHPAASKVWLGSISKLHRQQLTGPSLPRFHRATWQQVAIPETSLSLGPHCPRAARAVGARRPLCRGPCSLSSWVCHLQEEGPNTFCPVTTQQHRAEGGCYSPRLDNTVLGGRVW